MCSRPETPGRGRRADAIERRRLLRCGSQCPGVRPRTRGRAEHLAVQTAGGQAAERPAHRRALVARLRPEWLLSESEVRLAMDVRLPDEAEYPRLVRPLPRRR